jgi:hypothetical protein
MSTPAVTHEKRVTFAQLWANYPKDAPCVDSKGNTPAGWENQCAARVGLPLERSGVSFKGYPGARCPVNVAGHLAMVANAQMLADWLKRRPFAGCPPAELVARRPWTDGVAGRTGIVFFQDYWRRKGETRGNGSGDHIDLWNRQTLTPSIQSFLRFRLGISHLPNLNPFSRRPDNQNWYSDLEQCRQILFWQIP